MQNQLQRQAISAAKEQKERSLQELQEKSLAQENNFNFNQLQASLMNDPDFVPLPQSSLQRRS